MAKGFRAELEGDEELIKKFYGMEKEFAAGALEDAAQAGADVIADEANRNAPGPHIETDLKKKTRAFAAMEIGPDDDHWYYRFFETGTSAHEVTPKNAGGLELMWMGELIVRMIAHPSGMAAQPFLRPAHDEKKDQAVEATGREFIAVIDKYVEK